MWCEWCISHPWWGLSSRLRDHILRKGRALFPEATHLADLLPVSLNMLCSLLKQRFPCCWSPPWGHPVCFHCVRRFCLSYKALTSSTSSSLEPSLRTPVLTGPLVSEFLLQIPSHCTISLLVLHCHVLFPCSFLWVGVSGRRDGEFMCFLFHWPNH